MGSNQSAPVGGTTAVSIRASILRRKLTSKTGSRSVWMYVMHIKNFTLTPPPADVIARSNAANPQRPLFDKPVVVNDYYVPVALIPEGSDRIMKFGTYESYVPAGAFMCKLLEYLRQCDPKLKRCSVNYAYVGGRYAGIQDDLRPSAAPAPAPVPPQLALNTELLAQSAGLVDEAKRRHDRVVASQEALKAALAARAPTGTEGGKRRRRKHKTPRRPKRRQGRRARKSTFRRRRKH